VSKSLRSEGAEDVVSSKMKCPKCGADMNFHAQKIVHGLSSDSAELEADFSNTTLLEFHACPNCGAAASREIAV